MSKHSPHKANILIKELHSAVEKTVGTNKYGPAAQKSASLGGAARATGGAGSKKASLGAALMGHFSHAGKIGKKKK